MDNAVVIRSCFDQMFSEGFCGSKSVDFSATLPCATMVVMRTEDIEESLPNFEQLFRRYMYQKANQTSNASKKDELLVVVDTSKDKMLVQSQVLSYLTALYQEVDSEVSYND